MNYSIEDTIKNEISQCIKIIPPNYLYKKFDLISQLIDIIISKEQNNEEIKKYYYELNNYKDKIKNVSKLIALNNKESIEGIFDYGNKTKALIKEIINCLSFMQLDSLKCIANSKEVIEYIENDKKSIIKSWKYQEIFSRELITYFTNLTKVNTFIDEAEKYIKKNDIYKAIQLLNEIKEMEGFNNKNNCNCYLIGNIKKEKIIEDILIILERQILRLIFFEEEKHLPHKRNEILKNKIISYIKYFSNKVNKTNIEKDSNTIFQPLENFCNSITLLSKIIYNDNYSSKEKINKSLNNINSLPYIIICLNNLKDNTNHLLEKFMKVLESHLINLFFSIYLILTNVLTEQNLLKEDLLCFILFIQTPFIILFHSLEKIRILFTECNSLISYSKDKLNNIYKKYEAILSMQINILYNFLSNDLQDYITYSSRNFIIVSSPFEELQKCQSIYKHKLLELPFLSQNNSNSFLLILMLKNYSIFNSIIEHHMSIFFLQLENHISLLTKQFFTSRKKESFYLKGLRFFESSHLIFDYELNNNFNFIIRINKELIELEHFFIYATEKTLPEIEMCIQLILDKLLFDTKILVENIQKDTIYQNLIKLIKENKSNLTESIDIKVIKFIFQVANSFKGNENIKILSKNHKFIEILIKFISKIKEVIKDIKLLMKNIAIRTKIENSLYQIDQINNELFNIILIFKIELAALLIWPVKTLTSKSYWLKKPQMKQESSITSFALLTKTYCELYKQNLSQSEYNFIIENHFNLINKIFILCLSNLQTYSINHFGINLLIRNFDYIQKTLSSLLNIIPSNSIYNFINYINLLKVQEDKIEDELERYYQIDKYDKQLVEPILTIRTSTRKTIQEAKMDEIVTNIFDKPNSNNKK